MSDAVRKFPEVTTVVNFASFRSVFESCCEVQRAITPPRRDVAGAATL
jgi:hypothetical protein